MNRAHIAIESGGRCNWLYASWVVIVCTWSLLPVDLLQAQPGAAPGGQDQAPAWVERNFKDEVWKSGGPRLSQLATGKMVVGIEVTGNSTISQHKILSHMQTRPDRVFDDKQLQADIHELYRTDLFRRITPSTREVPGGVVVKLEVLEQPTVTEVIFHGNQAVNEGLLKKHVGIEIGDPINPFSTEMAKQRLVDLYREKGFNHADIQTIEGHRPGDRRVLFAIAEGNLERIWQIGFTGNAVFSTDLLQTKIKSRDAKNGLMAYLLNVANLNKIQEDSNALTAYYRSLGYFQAKVDHRLDYDETGKWVYLTFVINEGPQFHLRNIVLKGNRYFTTEQLQTALTLKEGEPFNLGKMSRDQRSIREDFYGREGFIFVDVSAEPHFSSDEDAKLDLVYHITEGDRYRAGPIRVHIDGDSSHTKHSVVLNTISLREGRMLDLREIQSSERRLKATQVFETNPTIGEPPRIEIKSPDEELLESSNP